MRLGVIIDGIYYPPYTKIKKPVSNKRAITDKQYGFDMQRINHQRDLIQPYKNGKPNDEFIAQYKEESKEYGFIPKE